MATAFAPPARHSSATHAYRHHPYAAPPAQSSSRPKWAAAAEKEKMAARDNLPPSPPRSRRDESETPSLGLPLGMAFGANGGGKWWDEELPAPPASLSSILESFRKSGEGDRDLLLSILGAKKAEEERLTALIQTRLTILQARLSLHSAAASVAANTPPPPMPAALEPRGSSSSSAPSPPLMTPVDERPSLSDSFPTKKSSGYWSRPSDRDNILPPIRTHGDRRPSGSVSPKSEGRRSQNGLDMLLDAGMARP